MFGPKHTVESVIKELIDGLQEGTIVLRSEDLPGVSLPEVKANLEKTVERGRRMELILTISSTISSLVGAALTFLCAFIFERTEMQGQRGLIALAILAGAFALVVLVAVFVQVYKLFKSHERTTELRTYYRVMKMTDEATAKEIANRISYKLLRQEEKERAH